MVLSYTTVIPAYNAAAFIADTIASVKAQTVPPVRIIVVDDGSTDATADIVSAIAGVELVRQANAGPGSATTLGLTMVNTELVATLDADDLWLHDKIERQYTALSADVAGVFGRMTNFRDSPSAADPAAAYDGWTRSTMLLRTSVAQATGPVIDPPGAGDMIDWLARVREGGHRLIMLPELVTLRRAHPASLTAKGASRLTAGYLSVARAALLRRRAKE